MDLAPSCIETLGRVRYTGVLIRTFLAGALVETGNFDMRRPRTSMWAAGSALVNGERGLVTTTAY